MGIPNAAQTVVTIKIAGVMASAGGRAVNTLNVFHYRRSTTANALNKAQVSAIFQTAVVVPLALALNVRFTQVNNTVRIVNDAQDQEVAFGNAAVGAIASDSYDSRSAVYMGYQTGIRGKRFRGSKHFAPLSEVDTTGDILTGAGLARWQTVQAACAASFTDAGGNTWIPVVLQGPPLSQLRTNPTTVQTADVTTVTLNKAIGSMKRRRAGSVY